MKLNKDTLTGRSIMVMDDDEDVRVLFKIILEGLGCTLIPASDGAEAITLYRQSLENGEAIDAVIMDQSIPGGMGGKETMGKIRALNPQAKLIISSGHTESEEMIHPRDHGYDAALEKNFNRNIIKQVLEQVFSSG